MKKHALQPTDPQTLAILHRTGKIWRGLVASTKSSPPEMMATRHFAADQVNRLDQWLDEYKASAVLCVLPSAAVICRNNPLPDASPEQLEQALHLQAEAHLLGTAPPHRLGMAVLPSAPGETTRNGLVLAWPDNASFSAPPTSRPVTFVPDVAALAALLNGQRPNEPLLWVDREDGSVALAVTHAGGAILRAVREDTQSPETFARNIGRIAAETALSVGHTGAYIESMVNDTKARAASLNAGDGRLFIPEEIIIAATARLKGVGADNAWWSQYGVAAGALLARTGPLSSLTRLQQSPPTEAPSPVRDALEKLSRPQMAAIVIAACVLVLMIGPLAFSGVRLLVLNLRFGEMNAQLKSAKEARQKLEVYQELQKQKTWPMTKLLADIAVNTPIGIELETIRIESGKDFAVGGTALATEGKTPAQLVALFQENLSHEGLFNDVAVNSGKSDNLGRYKFDISAKVAKPYLDPKLPEDLDFAKKPWRVRLYGPDAAEGSQTIVADSMTEPPIAVPNASQQVPPSENPPDIDYADTRRAEGSGGIGSNRADLSDDLPQAAPSAPPPPLDIEQLKVMSRAELKDALAKVARARLNKELDKDVLARLKQEQDLIMEHLRKANS